MQLMVPTLICLGIGIVFFIVEMLTPGLGVSGFLGALAFLAAVLLQIGNPVGILFMIALVLFLVAVGLIVFMKVVSNPKFEKNKLVLNTRIDGASTNLKEGAAVAHEGQEGITTTPLRPAGKAEFRGETLDVTTGGEFLPAGAKVRITRVEGLRILVQPLQEG